MRKAAVAVLAFQILLVGAPAFAAPNRGPAAACPSLANLRLLMQRASDDPAAAGAILADAKADHLGCILLERDRVQSVADRVAFGSHAYECHAIQGTSVCHWTIAGAVVPVVPPAPKSNAPSERNKR